jgi:cytochrome c5
MSKLTLAASATALAVVAALAGCGRHEETSTTASSTTTAPSPSSTYGTTAQAPVTTPAPTSPSTSDQASTNMASSAPPTTAPAGSDTTSASSTTAMGASGDGQTVYTKTCAVCHAAGVAGAPKLGDKSDWGPRVAQGKDTLYKHAMEGFQGKKGQMPPKGGNTALADADVKAAVDYMVSQAK